MAAHAHFRCGSCGGINRIPTARLADRPTCGRCRSPIDLNNPPHELDDDGLDRLVRAAPVPVLVDFWAPWCGPCRAVAPRLTALAHTLAGKLIVAKINTDQHQRTAARLSVRSIPTLAVYQGGQLQHAQPGALDEAALRRLVAPYLP